MKIAVDASALVAEVLRVRGRFLVEHPDLDLYIAATTWSEVEHEVGRRMRAMVVHGRLSSVRFDEVYSGTLLGLRRQITIVSAAAYQEFEVEARARVPRDPNDWPTVAVALALDAGIWTHDYDFFGCGVPVWITETLLAHLVD